jgi:hypothetical protein
MIFHFHIVAVFGNYIIDKRKNKRLSSSMYLIYRKYIPEFYISIENKLTTFFYYNNSFKNRYMTHFNRNNISKYLY